MYYIVENYAGRPMEVAHNQIRRSDKIILTVNKQDWFDFKVDFPELKESEDEKIRKELLDFFKSREYNCSKRFIAWLEKQGEKPNKVSIWKHWDNGIAGNSDGVLTYLTKRGTTYSLSSCLSFECDYIELSELDKLMVEKQGER